MFDIGEAEGAHFITMEYVAGEDLKTMIRMSTGLTVGTVLSVGKQVCQGLAEAHGLGVVHRDLKPQNIIIDKGGNAKIMDFGIARSMREKGITGGGVIIGTPEYMSPEQTEAKDVDQRSDIYSLGVILYEMATGRVPFEGDTALSIAIKHKTEIPKDPKSLNPGIPDDLRRLILRCLEKDRAKRYQSAAEVEAELEKIERGIPTTELSEHLPGRERYLIQSGYYNTSEATFDKAIEAYEKRLQIEPNEVNAARNLGLLYIYLEQWDRALELLQGNIKSGVEAVFPYTNAARAYSAKGLFDKAAETLENYRRSHADLSYIHERLAQVYLSQGKFDLAKEEADKAFTLAPSDYSNFLLKGDIQYLAGDFPGAEKEYLRILDSSEKSGHLDGRWSLGLLYLCQGKFGKAIEEAKLGMNIADELADKGRISDFLRFSAYAHLRTGKPKEALLKLGQARNNALEVGSITGQIGSLHLKGLAMLEINSINEAQMAAEEIKKLVEGWLNGKLIRYYYNLLGNIEIKKGNYSKAIENFNKAISFLDYQQGTGDAHTLFYEPLALAYLKSGALTKAQEQYEKITHLTTGRLGYGDIYAKSFYMLGRIAEQQRDKGRAIENYRKFLSLWKDADPGLPEVEDARRRLAGLKGNI